MWTIALFIGDGGSRQVNLVFRGEGTARVVWGELTREVVEDPIGDVVVSDDFGTTVSVPRDVIMGKVLQRAEGAAEAGVELGILQARSQSKI